MDMITYKLKRDYEAVPGKFTKWQDVACDLGGPAMYVYEIQKDGSIICKHMFELEAIEYYPGSAEEKYIVDPKILIPVKIIYDDEIYNY